MLRFPPSMERMSVPICRYAVAAYGMSAAHAVEQMDHTGVTPVGGFHARFPKPLRIRRALIAQRIEFGGVNAGRRQVRDIRHPQRRNAGMRGVAVRPEIVLQVVIQRRLVDEVAGGVVAPRIGGRAEVHDRT